MANIQDSKGNSNYPDWAVAALIFAGLGLFLSILIILVL